ncbi:hypothetical protein HWV07_16350 [Natronomonas salina]|uniref:DUF7118 family protein n=1 Tax=Natronomonas salina TaxID=1710540 RepID=UPI0015B50C51|nr:hypothetical protein [Natronomonas salina]QLD90520.1 hypothetical protein HWV07_16350 [Natronomonas salina]
MSTTTDQDAADRLAAAHDRLERLESDLELDREQLDAVVDACRSVERVLDRWEERATDWDDFQGYVEFRNDLSETLAAVPEDVPESEAFVEADAHVKTGSATQALKQRDFDAAREALAPARDHVERREELEDARREYREARRAAKRRDDELAERIDDLERLVELSEADLEAPVEELREPIETYDDRVRAAFATLRSEEPARELLAFAETASGYPLVEFEAPPEGLLTYVRDHPAGRHSVDELLEYAGYSASKLDHYVEDADLLKRRVATNRTYLEGLSADPLTVGWPPEERATLLFRTRELVSLVNRFADEETVAALRSVRDLARRDDYDRLRTAAVARADLTEAERRRVESGAVEEDLAAAREERERLRAALEKYG